MKNRKWVVPLCIIFGVTMLLAAGVLCAAGIMSHNGYGISAGRLYRTDTTVYLVDDGKAMILSDRSVGKKLFEGLASGDHILVIHDGVEESYPSRTGAHWVFKLSKGDESDLPEKLDIGEAIIEETGEIPNEPAPQKDLVRHSRGQANISLSIPEGWEYEKEDIRENGDFCIAFWPRGEKEGKIKVWYYEAFGICGTGLEQEKITVGGYEAYKCTYDNNALWDFIILEDTPVKYVIMNEGVEEWWSEHGDEAMEILDTVVVGEGILNE